MRRLSGIFVPLLVLGCGTVAPKVLSPGDVPGQVRALPVYVRLSFTGLAFWRDKLYAGTNIGLLEIDGNRASALYQWNTRDNVIEGPWVDQGGDALWFWDCHTLDFRCCDGREWTRTGMPPKKSYYSRGDVLSSFRGYSDETRFWIEGAGSFWSWDRQNREWAGEDRPLGGLRGIAPAGDGLYALISPRKPEVGKPDDVEFHVRRDASWEKITTIVWNGVIMRLVGTATGGYLLTHHRNLVRFDRQGIKTVTQPGVCEAMTATSEGYLLASFVGKGLFEHRGDQWILKCPYPYDEKEGKHWAFITESKGRIAFATGEESKVVDWDKGTQTWSGTSAVWVLKGNVLERVRLE